MSAMLGRHRGPLTRDAIIIARLHLPRQLIARFVQSRTYRRYSIFAGIERVCWTSGKAVYWCKSLSQEPSYDLKRIWIAS